MSGGKIAFLICAVGAAVVWMSVGSRRTETVFEPVISKIEAGNPIPWRDADREMTNWFPGATRVYTHDLVLSGKRATLQEQLGRPLLPEEMALHLYLVASNEVHLGTVLTRRLKGRHGAIEFALGVSPEQTVRALKIQQIREPAEITEGLKELGLENRYVGMSAADDFLISESGHSAVRPANDLANKIAADVKALLILYNAGQSEFRRRHH